MAAVLHCSAEHTAMTIIAATAHGQLFFSCSFLSAAAALYLAEAAVQTTADATIVTMAANTVAAAAIPAVANKKLYFNYEGGYSAFYFCIETTNEKSYNAIWRYLYSYKTAHTAASIMIVFLA